MNNTFIVSAIRFADNSSPTIQLFKDPISKKYIAGFFNFDVDELVDGYNYHEILSIRNTLTEVLNQIDTREVIDSLNNAQEYDLYNQDDGA